MKADKEISEVLGDITPQQMDAAIVAINNYGFGAAGFFAGDSRRPIMNATQISVLLAREMLAGLKP